MLFRGGFALVLLSISVVAMPVSNIIEWPFSVKHTQKGARIDVMLDSKKIRFFFDSNTSYNYGDKIELTGRVNSCEPPRNPGMYNFCDWQYRNGIDLFLFVKDHRLIQLSDKHSGLIWLSRFPQRLYHRMQQLFPDHSAVIYTMIFGSREDFLSIDIKSIFSHIGLIHLLVVSGAQIGVITAAVFFLMRLFRSPFLITFILILICQGGYLMITGLDASICRSVVMADLLLWHRFYLLRRFPAWWYLMIAAMVICIFMPKAVLSPGFWYSFSITYGLLIIPQRVLPFIQGPRWFVSYVIASLVAVIIAMPIQLIQTSSISFMSVISNLWIPWMSTIILLGGLFILVLSFFSQQLGQFFGQGIDFFAEVMIHLATIIHGFGGIVFFDRMTIWVILMSIIFIIVYAIYRHWILFVMLMIIWLGLGMYLSQRQFVLAIDVGQGDATLIVDGFYSVMIDSGGVRNHEPIAKKSIIPVLNYFGIDHLDLLIITHHDLDHVGGIKPLLSRGISKIISPEPLPLSQHQQINHPLHVKLPNGDIHVFHPVNFFQMSLEIIRVC